MDHNNYGAPQWQPQPEAPLPQPVTYHNPAPAQPSNAIEVVWQWISYALWQWTLFALSVFLSATLSYYLVKSSSSTLEYSFSIYAFAAVICLLPLAVFADRVYARHEPHEKHGFAAVVLVLNALLVFLAMLGGIITAVVSLFSLLVNGHGSTTVTATVIASLLITLLGLLLFLRMVRPSRLERFFKLFPLIVALVAVVTAVMGIAGPFRSLVSTRDDRLIEDNLGTINTAIQDYANTKSKLPATLDDLSLNSSYQDGAKQLVKRKLVTYTKRTPDPYSYTLSYTLCVHFKKSKGEGKKDIYSLGTNHGSGEECYNLETQNYSANTYDPYSGGSSSPSITNDLQNLRTQ